MGERVNETESRQQRIERYVDLYWRCENHKAVEKEFKALKDEICGWYADLPGEQGATAEGIGWNLEISPRREESSWADKLKLWRKLGGLKAIELWDVTQKVVKDQLGESALSNLLVKTRTGYRTIKPLRREQTYQEAA